MAQTEAYGQVMARLAELRAAVAAAQAEADQWYERQVAAAGAAVDEATAAAAQAAEELATAQAALQITDAEAAHLWRQLAARIGAPGARLGSTPPPTPSAAPADPDQLLAGVRDLLVRARQPRSLPGWAYPVLGLLGALGAALAGAAGWGLRSGGHVLGHDFAIALPVLGQIVTLLGPLVGLAPAKLLTDRQNAAFDATAIAVTVAAGLVATCALGITLRWGLPLR
jgi:hypothetical protein